MSSVRLLKRKGTLFFDFRVRCVRCREYTALADSEANRKRLKKVLDRIEAEIATGTFDYRRFFPESKLAAQFDLLARATPAIDKATLATPPFRDFAKQWYGRPRLRGSSNVCLDLKGHFATSPAFRYQATQLFFSR